MFIHLHVHSHYSLLDGLTKIDELVETAKKDGANAVALTDHGVMYGAIEFYKACKKAGIKPIIGMESYLAKGSRFERTATKDDEKRNYHLLLLAKNLTGYKNLVKLCSIAHLEGYYYKPRIDWDVLQKHSEGLIACTACLGGEIPRLIMDGKIEQCKKRILEYNQLFGQGNFYLEIQPHIDIPEQEPTNLKMVELARELNIPLVATNDLHYLRQGDHDAQDILLCLQTKKKKTDQGRMNMHGADFYYKTEAEMREAFPYALDALENTIKIADSCNLELELNQVHLPHFEVPENFTGSSFLRKLCEDGLIKRYQKNYLEVDEEIRKRLDYELSVVDKMGWPSYFLIVSDFVNWAKNRGIVVGPGRGSAAGSLICYLTGITNLDPLKYNLLFERFLNPDRISMPDIDLDFADTRRDEVIRYVEGKYGQDHVAQIITFGTMAARAAVKDVGRVLAIPYDYCDKLSKMIPMFTSLKEALEDVLEFKEIYEKEEQAKQIIDYALRLEGVARHASTHACGVLITKNPLTDYTPLQYAVRRKSKGGDSGGEESKEEEKTEKDESAPKNIVSQYSLHPVEDLGLLKMDFLGLKNLTIIEAAIKIIKALHGVEIDIDKIPLDEIKAFKLFQDGDTTGVFQFECLSGDTIVSNTTIKKLYEKKNKEKLLSVYLDEGKTHKNKILKVIESGIKPVYSLILENNRQIKATQEHSFLTDNGWQKLKDLKAGDLVLIKEKSKYSIYNTCKTCDKQISGLKKGESKFCYTCSASFYSNPSKEKSRIKMKQARQKFINQGGTTWNKGLTIENSLIWKKTAQKISKALTGRTIEDLYGQEKAKEIRMRMSEKSKGANNPMFGKSPHHRKGGFREDLGHYVRSNWEADFARILKLKKLEYQYEPKTFKLFDQNGNELHYTPDFFVPSENTFYEIKGWFHEADQNKIKLFCEQFPQYNFVLINTTKFAEFALKYKHLVKWECPKIPNGFNFVKVKDIKFSGEETTYDIAMEAPGNNFIANSFVVHNSNGMKRYLKELKPTEFENIIAMAALYRPGPMEWIPDYIAGKHKRKQLTYLHPKLEPILAKTYGVAIYQEQVMQMARDLAGFTMAQADVLRKAMGKKIPALLAEQKDKFIKGCVAQGLDAKLGEKVFAFIEPFAGYGFNRCLVGDTLILNSQTGEPIKLKDIYYKYQKKEKMPTVLTLTDNLKLKKGQITAVYNNGIKNIFEIKTRLGKTIKATANHPFKVLNDWKTVAELKIEDRIAIARQTNLNLKENKKFSDYQLIVLGYLLAEGNLCHPHSFYYYSKDENEIQDYIKNLEQFKNTQVKIDRSKSAASVYVGRKNLKEKCIAVEWIKKIGIHFKKATEKKIPDFVFTLSNNQIALVLAKMFQGDGCISLKRKYPQIFYATSSFILAQQYQSLLLRLEIISTIHEKKFKYRGDIKIGWTITINRYTNLQKFIQWFSPYLVGEKKLAIENIAKNHNILAGLILGNSARGSKDIVPLEVRNLIVAEAKLKGWTLKKLAAEARVAPRLFFSESNKKGYLRETLLLIAKTLNSAILFNLADSDIYWDEIVNINQIDNETTYDLTIEGTHNFLANDIIVHNSHAACYAMIAYQTAYLKALYPTEFMAALLTSDQDNTDRIAIEIEECRSMGINVLAPNINQSFESFTVVEEKDQKQSIRFGLKAIKNVGGHIAEVIIEERKKNGEFKNLTDFLTRITDKDLNKKSLESLIKAGGLDSYGERGVLLASLDNLLSFNKEIAKQKSSGQNSLFGVGSAVQINNEARLVQAPPIILKDQLAWEKELLGLYLSAHPYGDFKKYLENTVISLIDLKHVSADSNVSVAGVIIALKKINTRSGDAMYFVKIEDTLANTELLVFPRTLKETTTVWQEGKVILCAGKISAKDGESKIIVDTAIELEIEKIESQLAGFKAKIKDKGQVNPAYFKRNPLKLILKTVWSQTDLAELKKELEKNPGSDKVYFKVSVNNQPKIVEIGIKVNNEEKLRSGLINLFKEKIEIVN